MQGKASFNMTDEELKELFRELEAQGWNPQLCDTPVPVYETPVRCGSPTELGDILHGDEQMMPHRWITQDKAYFTTVKGDSMLDADIQEGDLALVEETNIWNDGDILLVNVDGAFTLKAYCRDEEGNPWLVPQNKALKAIPLVESQNVIVKGVVRQVLRQMPRISYRSCISVINKAKAQAARKREITPDMVTAALQQIAPDIKVARWWYAVFRPLVDCGAMPEEGAQEFCERVRQLLPDHASLPTPKEIQRMAVQSFAKPVALWQPSNAPVQGTRYKDYLDIANKMRRLLSEV